MNFSFGARLRNRIVRLVLLVSVASLFVGPPMMSLDVTHAGGCPTAGCDH